MDSPLSKPDIAALRRAAAKAHDCRRKIELAKQAGLSIEEQELRCDHLQRSLQAMIDAYSSITSSQPK